MVMLNTFKNCFAYGSKMLVRQSLPSQISLATSVIWQNVHCVIILLLNINMPSRNPVYMSVNAFKLSDVACLDM